MQIMGLLLFLWIIVGSSIGMYLVGRTGPRTTTTRVRETTGSAL